jgi:hypothetical protein
MLVKNTKDGSPEVGVVQIEPGVSSARAAEFTAQTSSEPDLICRSLGKESPCDLK